ncbi:MAG: sigma-54-dependent Fis family transcriptional regulator [Gemmatimonadaceae bacterium]|nr:sigma-54-dependent Fis family transcriptional regulator [Gemmatimonadaceae bacterium]
MNSTRRLLLVEDDPAIRFALRDFLGTNGYAVTEAATCADAERAFERERPALVLSDYRLPDGTALDLLPRIRALSAVVPFLVLTGHGSVELAVEAIRQGADDFLTKPVSLPALAVVLDRALDRQRERQRSMARAVRQQRATTDPFVGESAAIHRLREQAERIAATDRPVLILGETGAGKGVLTRWLHAHGARADEAFVDLNCASLPRELLESELFGFERGAFTGAVTAKMGLVELAHRGTLFLDEIGDLELSLQPKLLKVLEDQVFRRVGAVKDRQVDVRLVAATHQDLPNLVGAGKFRGDLYFRISTIPLHVPPLRERKEDIPILARRLLERLAGELGRASIELTPSADEALARHPWPGNVRELRNVLERAVLLSARGSIRAADLTFDAPAALTPAGGTTAIIGGEDHLTLEELQRRHIIRVLELVNGRVEVAAQRLGVPRSTLYQKLKAMRIAVARPAS